MNSATISAVTSVVNPTPTIPRCRILIGDGGITSSHQWTADSAFAPRMAELLEAAGFHIHGRRAQCIHCQGHSRLTVSFTDEVYFCHRCGKGGNIRTLSRQLGRALPQQTPEQRRAQTLAKEFTSWRNAAHALLVREYEYMRLQAGIARLVLRADPGCEEAWDLLARFYDAERYFLAAFDLLSCEPLSRWLERPMTKEKLRAAFDKTYEDEDADAA
jgi:hypothetical protein